MAASQPHPFERAFPRKQVFRGAAGAVVLLSAVSSILLVLLLFVCYLTVDLLESRGRLSLDGSQAQTLYNLASVELDEGEAHNTGLLAVVWRHRDEFWAPAAGRFCGRFAWLQDNVRSLVVLVLLAVSVGLVRALLLARVERLSLRTGLGVVTRLRRMLHRQALRLGPGDLQDAESGHVLDLFTNKADQLRDGIAEWVRRWGRFPFELLLLVLLAVSVNWRAALQCLIPLAACWYVVHRERIRLRGARRLAADRARSELQVLAEGFRKSRLVAGYGMHDWEHEQFQKHLDRHDERLLAARKQERWSRWAAGAIALLCGAIVVLLISMKVLAVGEAAALTLAGAFLLLAAFACMFQPLELLWSAAAVRSGASIAADQIYRHLNQIPSVSQAVGAKFLQPVSRSIQFESVAYTLPGGRPLLTGVDLKLDAGLTVSFVSLEPLETRAVACLLPRFIEPTKGRILFDGNDIAWATLESLRAEAVYVGGTDPFFTGTVLENIRCGNESYSLQAATDAAKLTHAHNFILRLPQGYETQLGEHGEQLDPGQGFRLGLARAALRKPAVMIIEEPADQLDEDAKSLLDDAYSRLRPGRTVIFLPSRLSTVRKSDRVVFLHRGRVEAVGRHDDLVRSSELYRHWEYVRFNQFRQEREPSRPPGRQPAAAVG